MSYGPTAATPDNCRRKANRHRCYRLHGRTDKVEQVEKINFTIVFTGWMVGVGTILGMILDWGLIWLLGILWQDVRFLKLLRIVFFFRYNFRTEHSRPFSVFYIAQKSLTVPSEFSYICIRIWSKRVADWISSCIFMHVSTVEFSWQLFSSELKMSNQSEPGKSA